MIKSGLKTHLGLVRDPEWPSGKVQVAEAHHTTESSSSNRVRSNIWVRYHLDSFRDRSGPILTPIWTDFETDLDPFWDCQWASGKVPIRQSPRRRELHDVSNGMPTFGWRPDQEGTGSKGVNCTQPLDPERKSKREPSSESFREKRGCRGNLKC